MADIRKLQPHDPVPEGPGITLIRRFEEDDPRLVMVQLVVSAGGGPPELLRAAHPDGRPMAVREAIAEARRRAEAAGIAHVYVIDRLAGPREREILAHQGDHSLDWDKLDDFDLEEGERGSDMRDRR